MANMQVEKNWSPIRILETHELARGGINGNMNEQAKSLAERTELLKAEKADKSYVNQIAANVNAGIHNYKTEAELLAFLPDEASYTAKALDTKSVWYWDGASWENTGFSEYELAKQYTIEQTKKVNYILQGQITKLEYNSSRNAYVISHTGLRIRQGSGRGSVFIAAADDVEVPVNAAYYVDLSNVSLTTNSTVEPAIAPGWLSSAQGTGSFVEDLKYVLFCWNDIPARFGGNLLKNGISQILDTKMSELNVKIEPLAVQDRKNSYILQGRITSANFDTSVQAWTIAHSRLVISLGSGRGFVSVDARSGIVVHDRGCYYIDLSGKSAGDVIVGDVLRGWMSAANGDGSFVDDLKLLLFTSTGTSGQTYGGRLVQNGMPSAAPSASVSGAIDTIYAKKTATQLEFYAKGTGSNYIKYLMIKHDNPALDLSNIYGHRQLWRLTTMSEVDSAFNVVRADFVTGGENELAISHSPPRGDSVGGFHGDEIYSHAFFVVDGKYYNESDTWSGNFHEIRFVQESTMYECDSTVAFAKHTKNYSFTKNGLLIDQEVEFLKDLNLRNIWLGMLCIRRNLNGATGELITTTAIYPNHEVVDVSVPLSFPRLSRQIEKYQTMTITGDVGLSAEIKILDFNFDGYNVHVHNDNAYNKIYFNANRFSDSEVVSKLYKTGDVLKSTLLYKINTSN